MLQPQRAIGNQAAQRLLGPGRCQAKLRIGQPGDMYEQEADRVADRVMRMPAPTVRPIRAGEGEPVQRQQATAGNGAMGAAPTSVQDTLRSPGQPLDPATRAFFEPRFGHDFSRVRVHTDTPAAQSARSINALAYTVGGDIVFGAGQYAPGSAKGRQLLAHELTHVVQQTPAAATVALPERPASSVAGRLDVTAPSVLYRQPVTTPSDPTFSVVGTPNVTATADGTEVNSHSQVTLFLGDFVTNARVQVQAPDTTTMNDWEVGIAQMVSGAVDASCYQRPARRPGEPPGLRIFVERMHAPTQMFHPDRDPASPVFVDSSGMVDLGASHGGRSSFVVPLHAEDHPQYRGVWGFASAHTHNLADTDVELTRHRHRGFFYTYVVARQKSTGRLIPLYTARWWMASDYGYFSPGAGIDFTATNRGSLTFRLIERHTFSPSDFFPVLTGETMQQLSRRREQEWRTGNCPGFVELGGGQ